MREFWTDGSAVPNPGEGGFAVIEVRDGEAKPIILGRKSNTTNIQMEGWAIIQAMKRADGEPCEIHTDSNLWVQTMQEWAPEWAANDWHKKDEKIMDRAGNLIGYKETKIKNLDIVKEMYELYNPDTMKFVWERGHVGTQFNEMADEWANKAREGEKL